MERKEAEMGYRRNCRKQEEEETGEVGRLRVCTTEELQQNWGTPLY